MRELKNKMTKIIKMLEKHFSRIARKTKKKRKKICKEVPRFTLQNPHFFMESYNKLIMSLNK